MLPQKEPSEDGAGFLFTRKPAPSHAKEAFTQFQRPQFESDDAQHYRCRFLSLRGPCELRCESRSAHGTGKALRKVLGKELTVGTLRL